MINQFKKFSKLFEVNRIEIDKHNKKIINALIPFAIACCSILIIGAFLIDSLLPFRVESIIFLGLYLALFCFSKIELQKKKRIIEVQVAIFCFITLVLGACLNFLLSPQYPCSVFAVVMVIMPLIFLQRPIWVFIQNTVCGIIIIFLSFSFLSWQIAIGNLLLIFFTYLYSVFFTFNNLIHMIISVDASRRLAEMSQHDELTKLPNRRFFNNYMDSLKHFFNKPESDIGIIMFDVDLFKLYNDAYGHIQGDICLEQLSVCFEEFAKEKNVFIARFGGEEFICVLTDGIEKEIASYAEELRSRIQNLNIVNDQSPFGVVTVSVGYATKQNCKVSTCNALINKADEKLYLSKANGRNRVTG